MNFLRDLYARHETPIAAVLISLILGGAGLGAAYFVTQPTDTAVVRVDRLVTNVVTKDGETRTVITKKTLRRPGETVVSVGTVVRPGETVYGPGQTVRVVQGRTVRVAGPVRTVTVVNTQTKTEKKTKTVREVATETVVRTVVRTVTEVVTDIVTVTVPVP